jgi:hypothetical protein
MIPKGLPQQRHLKFVTYATDSDTSTRHRDEDPVLRVDVRVRPPQSNQARDNSKQQKDGNASQGHLGQHLDCYI